MRFWEGIRLALTQVWTHKLKSFFSLVGVIIGITFLIAVITIVEGMNRYVREDFAGSIFGVNTFTVVRRSQVNTGAQSEERRRREARNPDLVLHDVEVVRAAAPDAKHFAYMADRFLSEVRSGGDRPQDRAVLDHLPHHLLLVDQRYVLGELLPEAAATCAMAISRSRRSQSGSFRRPRPSTSPSASADTSSPSSVCSRNRAGSSGTFGTHPS